METTSSLDVSQLFQKSVKRCPSVLLKEKIGGYIVLALVLVFFAIPFAGMFLHLHKHGVRPISWFGRIFF